VHTPGVVGLDSNKEVLLTGATILQFPSVKEISIPGTEGLGSASLYTKIIVPKGIHDHKASCENLTAPLATPPLPCEPSLSSNIHPLISIQGGVGLLQLKM